jgi:hypothetical protein
LIKLTVKDADEVFKVEDKEKELNEKKAVGDFLQFIDDFKVPKKLSSERVTELILKSSADDNTKELALDILKEIG